MPDHRAREALHEFVRVAAEDETKVRDPRLSQCPEPLQAFLRRAHNGQRPQEFFVEEFQVLLGKLQKVMLVEARVIAVRVDVMPLHPALKALNAPRQRRWRLAAQAASVDTIAEDGADRR